MPAAERLRDPWSKRAFIATMHMEWTSMNTTINYRAARERLANVFALLDHENAGAVFEYQLQIIEEIRSAESETTPEAKLHVAMMRVFGDALAHRLLSTHALRQLVKNKTAKPVKVFKKVKLAPVAPFFFACSFAEGSCNTQHRKKYQYVGPLYFFWGYLFLRNALAAEVGCNPPGCDDTGKYPGNLKKEKA